jgi:hypothetical protein
MAMSTNTYMQGMLVTSTGTCGVDGVWIVRSVKDGGARGEEETEWGTECNGVRCRCMPPVPRLPFPACPASRAPPPLPRLPCPASVPCLPCTAPPAPLSLAPPPPARLPCHASRAPPPVPRRPCTTSHAPTPLHRRLCPRRHPPWWGPSPPRLVGPIPPPPPGRCGKSGSGTAPPPPTHPTPTNPELRACRLTPTGGCGRSGSGTERPHPHPLKRTTLHFLHSILRPNPAPPGSCGRSGSGTAPPPPTHPQTSRTDGLNARTHQAAVAVVDEELRPHGARAVVVHAARPVRHVAHHQAVLHAWVWGCGCVCGGGGVTGRMALDGAHAASCK